MKPATYALAYIIRTIGCLRNVQKIIRNNKVQDKDKLQICWQAFSMENSLLQSYRMLFMTLETVLLALGFVLLELFEGRWIFIPAIAGWVVAFVWAWTCRAKGKDVDIWRDRILGLQSIVGQNWFEYLRPGFKLSGGSFARILFNYILPIFVTGLWILIVFADWHNP